MPELRKLFVTRTRLGELGVSDENGRQVLHEVGGVQIASTVEGGAVVGPLMEWAEPEVVPDAMSALLYEVCAETERQDNAHGAFSGTRVGVSRLALAVLQDEIDEAHDWWRAEKGGASGGPDWEQTRREVIQVAAVALRALRDVFHEDAPTRPDDTRSSGLTKARQLLGEAEAICVDHQDEHNDGTGGYDIVLNMGSSGDHCVAESLDREGALGIAHALDAAIGGGVYLDGERQ
jgi:hypothetical protein